MVRGRELGEKHEIDVSRVANAVGEGGNDQVVFEAHPVSADRRLRHAPDDGGLSQPQLFTVAQFLEGAQHSGISVTSCSSRLRAARL